MIIEGLLTTTSPDGSAHVAPMGPVVNETLTDWRLRPFQTSTTFANLRRNGLCIFNVVDDVLPVVQGGLGLPVDLDFKKTDHGGWAIASACQWFCLQAGHWDISQPRSEVTMRVLAGEVVRPFWGWNRAKHACLEATILATRIQMTGKELVQLEMTRLANAVQKTGGPREMAAWKLIEEYVASK